MSIQEQIEHDLKEAMLAGDKPKVETLRGLKTALQYEADSLRAKETGLSEEQVQKVLAKEAKKRAETAEIYEQNNEAERAAAEKAEKAIIDAYLPEQLGDDEIAKVVQEEIADWENPTPADMGKIIGAVRSRLRAGADGATIAKLVKESLEK